MISLSTVVLRKHSFIVTNTCQIKGYINIDFSERFGQINTVIFMGAFDIVACFVKKKTIIVVSWNLEQRNVLFTLISIFKIILILCYWVVVRKCVQSGYGP